MRQALASYHYATLRKVYAAFLQGGWTPSSAQRISEYPISLTSWTPRLDDLPLVLLTLLQQSLQPRDILVWLTPEDLKIVPAPVRERFAEFRVRFQACENLKPHKKWLPMIERGESTPFVICDDDIVYPRDWFEELVREDRADAYVGTKCHRITFTPDGSVRPYSAWEKQIESVSSPSHDVFVTGCGGAVIHPARISDRFLDRAHIMRSCPKADDIWIKAAHVSADIPCYKTRYSFPCLELPGTGVWGLAHSNVDAGGNDSQITDVFAHFGLKLRPNVHFS